MNAFVPQLAPPADPLSVAPGRVALDTPPPAVAQMGLLGSDPTVTRMAKEVHDHALMLHVGDIGYGEPRACR